MAEEEEERTRRERGRNYRQFTNEDIRRLVSNFRKIQDNVVVNVVDNTFFTFTFKKRNRQFDHDEMIYELSVDRNATLTLPDILNSLRAVFQYIVNVAKSLATSRNDGVRVYFSRAPSYEWSTSLMFLHELTVQRLLDTFARHLQSNKEEILKKGWKTDVCLFVFDNDVDVRQKQERSVKRRKKASRYLKRDLSEGGEMARRPLRLSNPIYKYGREVRKGVFSIREFKAINAEVPGCCFAVALLFGRSHMYEYLVRNGIDTSEFAKNASRAYTKVCTGRNVTLDDVFTVGDVRNVYKKSNVPCGRVCVSDLTKIYEGFLKPQNIHLVVVSKRYFDERVFDSRYDDDGRLTVLTNRVIFLWLNDNHYDLILSFRTFSKKNLSNFCVRCMCYLSRFEFSDSHVCKTELTCLKCYAQNCSVESGYVKQCTNCDVIFESRSCFEMHTKNALFKSKCRKNNSRLLLTPCQYLHYCSTCGKIAPRFFWNKKNEWKKHDCAKVFCYQCDKYVKKPHECYMKPLKFTVMRDPPRLYFFDFETKVDENKDMVPFYCIVQRMCRICDKIPFEQTLDFFLPDPASKHCDMSVSKVDCCGYRQFVFECGNDSVVDELIDFVLTQQNCVWIAHNGGRFDSIFILRHLLIEKKIIPDSVLNGNQSLSIDVPGKDIKIVDSYLFLNMPLKNFPKAMGIENVEKGYHPYLFTDLTYRGPMISEKYFDEKIRDDDKFKRWYAKKCQQREYVFYDEIYYYCKMDVDILRMGCVKFSHLMEEITRVAPFYDKSCITIASLALKVYRLNF